MITTHVLDTSVGRPAGGMLVSLTRCTADGRWDLIGQGATDDNGRLRTLVAAGTRLEPGVLRLRFETGAYFAGRGLAAFYPVVEVVFELSQADGHLHVPLLVSPFGYTTYRGS